MKRLLFLVVLAPTVALADTYEIGGSETGGEISLYNRNTDYSLKINYLETFNTPDPYSNLCPDPCVNGQTPNEMYYSGGTNPDEATDILGYMGITDIREDRIYFESSSNPGNNNQIIVSLDGGQTIYNYGRKAVYNLTTSQVETDVLIAYTQEAYDHAVSAGYTNVELRPIGENRYPTVYSFQSYATNLTNNGSSNGGLLTDQVTTTDGNSMIRSESDGTIHIGVNSFVFAEAGTNGFQHDTMYSSLGTLQIGNNSDHRTIVRGSLEIEEPTAPNHAATKNYVDDSAALAMAMTALPRSYNGKTVVGVAGGHSGDNSAFALGISKSEVGGNVQFNLNLGYSESTSFAGAAGVGWEF